MMKEITVVMPVYKVEKYVSECLDSIINQTLIVLSVSSLMIALRITVCA